MQLQHLARATILALCLPALGVVTLAGPAGARTLEGGGRAVCLTPTTDGTTASARGGSGDTRPVSASEQRAIDARTQRILKAKGYDASAAPTSGTVVPVYVHKMLSSTGAGDVTSRQISRQIAELNQDFGGGESRFAADSEFTFTLAGVNAYYKDQWHVDHASLKYRAATRQGGANALNIWLVDFKYLGIATFPWDYSKQPGADGIRVDYGSLPGGPIANYDEGKTATHEAGHWLGLFHTFEGGCTERNDEVADTPAQSSPTFGCPIGRDSCDLPGLDPIHNYMDYSYDSCYDQFTPGQSSRMSSMWAAYRA